MPHFEDPLHHSCLLSLIALTHLVAFVCSIIDVPQGKPESPSPKQNDAAVKANTSSNEGVCHIFKVLYFDFYF